MNAGKGACRTGTVAAVSFLVNYLFFFEYLPPFKRVHIPYDLDGFHFPLVDYAFRALRQGRFPEWDAAIYCGQSFVGNIQAALFYPLTWVLFGANAGRERVLYVSLEILVILHVWLAFVLCFLWLRWKGLDWLPSVLGSGVFAYSGYMLLQLQHQGVVMGYAWMPLGLWGIDQCASSGRWQPLWKLAASSALCLLAGYPPTWTVLCFCAATYALFQWRWKTVCGSALALGLSLLISAVQLLPAWEANGLKAPEMRYGTGIREPEFYLSYVLPNYFDFGMNVDRHANRGGEYLYLGVPALFGLVCLLRRGTLRTQRPLLATGVVALVMVTNPFGAVWQALRHSMLLSQVVRDWYFLAGLTLVLAPLSAHGLSLFFTRKSGCAPHWMRVLLIVLLAGWSVRQIYVWVPGGAEFGAGLNALFEPAIGLLLFSSGAWALRGSEGAWRGLLAAALLLMVSADYKALGTSKRFNAAEGRIDPAYRYRKFPGIEDALYQQLRAHPEYRVALDDTGPLPLELRHHDLSTPQGFDPFLTSQYRARIDKLVQFRSNWEFTLDAGHDEALKLLAVRYFITSEAGPQYPLLSSDSRYRLMQPSNGHYKVFEFMGARPAYRWVAGQPGRSVQCVQWEPQAREFVVRSEKGGRFAMVEQFFPGWRAFIDGKPVQIERWEGAFQAIVVPPGEHRVRFAFRSAGLRTGAGLSIASLALLVLLGSPRRKPPLSKAES